MADRASNILGRHDHHLRMGADEVRGNMSLYKRLMKEENRLGKIVRRSPKTKQELLDRERWERVTKILTRRYEYGLDTFLDDLRREDHLDEIRDISRTRMGL